MRLCGDVLCMHGGSQLSFSFSRGESCESDMFVSEFPSVSVTCLLKEVSTLAWSESVSDLEAYGS